MLLVNGDITVISQLKRELKESPAVILLTCENKNTVRDKTASMPGLIDEIINKPVTRHELLDTLLRVCHQGTDIIANEVNEFDPLAAARSIQGASILLVEDNRLNQLVAKRFLEKAGLTVVIANNGEEALANITQHRFDAVLMDLHMPIMDGFEAARRIRAMPKTKNLPIIAMTAAAMQQDKDACYAVGMNEHIAKPVVIQELVECLVTLIRPQD